MVLRAVTASSFLILTVAPAHADRRLFTYTYEYKTMPQGSTAIELWHTETRDDWTPQTTQHMQHVLEIEHGLTDHWDAALYTVFTQTAAVDPAGDEAFALHEMKLETRYRFADRGEWPVDLLAYGEIAKEFGASVYEVETKAIVARDFDMITAAVNLIAAVEFGRDVPETEVEIGWAAGATYEVHPKFNLGVETFGAVHEDEVEASVGPALAVAPSSNLWLAFTAAFGLTDPTPAFAGRVILGIEL
jgi:hypothetical protein